MDNVLKLYVLTWKVIQNICLDETSKVQNSLHNSITLYAYTYIASHTITYVFIYIYTYNTVVQSLNHIRFFATSWTAAHQAPVSSTVSQSLLRFMSIESVTTENTCPPTLTFYLKRRNDKAISIMKR